MTTDAQAADALPSLQPTVAVGRATWAWAILAFVVTVAAAATLAAGFLYGLTRAYDGRALPGVTVAGVAVGGLDRAEAAARLTALLPSPAAGELTVTHEGTRTAFPYGQLGRAYDLPEMLDAAFAIGRGGDLPGRAIAIATGFMRETNVAPRYVADEASVARAIDSVADQIDVPPIDASARLLANGTFAMAPSAPGRVVDRPAAVRAAVAVLTRTGVTAPSVELATSPVSPVITDQEVTQAVQQATTATAFDVTAAAGPAKTDRVTIPAAKLRSWVAFEATPGGGFVPTVATAAARKDLAAIVAKLDTQPTDASFLTGNGKVIGVLPAKDGRTVNVDASLTALDAALTGPNGPAVPVTINLVTKAVPPALTTASAQSAAPLMTLVSTWTTHFVPSEANYWGKNISIPTSILDGYVVAPGAWFDFWQAVGEVSEAKGYGPGGAILNGHTQETGALAGGICSCSTTLFNAAARAGYQIGARANHYYYISRYPVGLDATVWKTDGAQQTMSFRNDTAYPVLIRGINGPGTVRFDLYSVDPRRTVSFTTPIIKNYNAAHDSVAYTTTLKPGTSERVEFVVDGFDAWVTRTVNDASGAIIHQETFYSHYARVDGLLLVGVAPGDPRLPKSAPPSPAAPSPTPAPTPSPTPQPTPAASTPPA